MGKDTPDWGGIYNSGQFYPLFDMAELAARLGSPITYDRRGALIWHYDFSDGIGDVGPTTSGTGSVVFLTTSVWENPPFCCSLQAGSTDGAFARIERRVAVPQSLRVGFQASIRAGSNVSQIFVNLWHYTGDTLYFSYLLADLDANTLQVRTSPLSPVTLVTLDAAFPDLTTGYYFAHFKLVADLGTHKLMRALVDDQEHDLSMYAMASQADASAPHVLARVTNEGHNLVNSAISVDNLIITAAEP